MLMRKFHVSFQERTAGTNEACTDPMFAGRTGGAGPRGTFHSVTVPSLFAICGQHQYISECDAGVPSQHDAGMVTAVQ